MSKKLKNDTKEPKNTEIRLFLMKIDSKYLKCDEN